MDTQHVHESTEMASRLYREAMVVPYMSKFVVFAKRRDAEEAQLRCFCITDDKVDKTLECQEAFELMAASPEVEVSAASARVIDGPLALMFNARDSNYCDWWGVRKRRQGERRLWCWRKEK